MRAINVLLAILVSALIGAAALEGGLRLIGFGPKVTLNQYDKDVGWSKTPNLSLSRAHPDAPYDIDFELNSMGLRDDEVQKEKAADTLRVLCLGDSFTLGFGVNRDDLFVDILERWWNNEGRRVEVINAGTEGYSTDQEAAWLETVGADLEPDLVLVFPYENDIYWNGQERYFDREKPRYSADGTREARTLADPGPKPAVEKWALTNLFFGKGPTQPGPEDLFQPATAQRPMLREWGAVMIEAPDFMTEPLARTRGSLEAIRKTCSSIGAKLVVTPIPSHSVVDTEFRADLRNRALAGLPNTEWSPEKPVQTFLDFCSELGIQTIDPRTPLKISADAGEELYWDKDWHLNPKGNYAFAKVLHDELDKLDVFPEGRTAPKTAADMSPPPPATAGGAPGWIKWFVGLWVGLSTMYMMTYKDEPKAMVPLKIGALLAVIFGTILGVNKLTSILPPAFGQALFVVLVLGILGFVAYKLGRRLGTITELFKAFTLRGHWYLMPLVVILLTIGSLLVVAASSPLVAPFIYTLF